jgi:hypothetical protein
MRMCALYKTVPVAFPLDAEYIEMRCYVRMIPKAIDDRR